MVFGHIMQAGFKRAAPYLLASLVFHREYLVEILPGDHPLWESAFGQLGEEDIRRLRTDITLSNDSQIKLSGIPVSVRLLEQHKTLLLMMQAQVNVKFHLILYVFCCCKVFCVLRFVFCVLLT